MSLRIYTVKAGKHDFWPPEPRTPHFRQGFSWTWEVVFDATCRYTLPGEDQGDFNKGGGVSFNLLSNNRNAVMWGWRYQPKNDMIQLCLYINKDGKKQIGHDGDLVQLEIPIAERAKIQLTYLGGNTWAMGFYWLDADDRIIDAELVHFTIKTPTILYRLGLWFGGNRPAPNDMQVWVDLKK